MIVLKKPKISQGGRYCLFACYSPDGSINKSAQTYISQLAQNNIDVIVCAAMRDMADTKDFPPIHDAAGILLRENGGMDFASWACILKEFPDLYTARQAIFTNDSVIPLPELLGKMLAQLEDDPRDFVALTDSYAIKHHAQSYFFSFNSRALQNKTLQAYWGGLEFFEDKSDIIKKHEASLLLRCKKDWGLSTDIKFPIEKILRTDKFDKIKEINVCHSYWLQLINNGFPFIKFELLRENPFSVPILGWQSVVELYGLDADIVAFDLQKQKKVGRSSALQDRARSYYAILERDPTLYGFLREFNKLRRRFRRLRHQ
ncbi:MAG: rhamnan synthesis F family protein [Pseudomonadota bacterium]